MTWLMLRSKSRKAGSGSRSAHRLRRSTAILLGALLLVLDVWSFAATGIPETDLDKYVLLAPKSEILFMFEKEGATIYDTNLPKEQRARGYKVLCRGEVIADVEPLPEGVVEEESLRSMFRSWNEICTRQTSEVQE